MYAVARVLAKVLLNLDRRAIGPAGGFCFLVPVSAIRDTVDAVDPEIEVVSAAVSRIQFTVELEVMPGVRGELGALHVGLNPLLVHAVPHVPYRAVEVIALGREVVLVAVERLEVVE